MILDHKALIPEVRNRCVFKKQKKCVCVYLVWLQLYGSVVAGSCVSEQPDALVLQYLFP